ncbi:hypothetical protein ACOMHN_022182 [Nucella lapillus]
MVAFRDQSLWRRRSYRNPNRAEILADFSSPNPRGNRPKTVPIRRPLVPQPYFYRHYSTHPGAASISAVTAAQQHYHSSSLASAEVRLRQRDSDFVPKKLSPCVYVFVKAAGLEKATR